MTIAKKVVNPAFKSDSTEQQGFGPGIVSTDSCGPYTVPSLHDNFVGNQNFMLMDSKLVFCYGYVNKTAETMLKNLKHLLDTEMKLLNLGVVRYHSDGAKELSGKEVKQFLDSRGIAQTTSTPYTAQENAFIERHFGMEQNATVAMMMNARFLPKSQELALSGGQIVRSSSRMHHLISKKSMHVRVRHLSLFQVSH
jgi:hypothetical protein